MVTPKVRMALHHQSPSAISPNIALMMRHGGGRSRVLVVPGATCDQSSQRTRSATGAMAGWRCLRALFMRWKPQTAKDIVSTRDFAPAVLLAFDVTRIEYRHTAG